MLSLCSEFSVCSLEVVTFRAYIKNFLLDIIIILYPWENKTATPDYKICSVFSITSLEYRVVNFRWYVLGSDFQGFTSMCAFAQSDRMQD